MELICYLHPGWAPLIRPAPATRAWMDASPDAFAYRCLPLNIANAHGWEVLSPCGFEASWNGGGAPADVEVRLDPGSDGARAPVGLFGQGVLTFHVEGVIRTPPGWNLMVGGSPNAPKDGIFPLSGVIETDWSPFTFTMNWRFTRPHHPVRFEAGEPFCFLFPVQRGAVEAFEPKFLPMSDEPDLPERFGAWSRARDTFQAGVRASPPALPSKHWQKHYYRGVDIEGRIGTEDHQSKLRLKPFDAFATPGPATDALAQAAAYPAWPEPRPGRPAEMASEQLLEAIERQRQLSPAAAGIGKVSGLEGEAFLERYYAPGRPVIITGELAGWPALESWTADRLGKLGAEVTGENLGQDIRLLGKFLERPAGRISIEKAGNFMPLGQESANQLTAQVTGRRRFVIAPPAYGGRLAGIQDLERLDEADAARLAGAHAYRVVLEPGELLYLPIGWWRQARALELSAAVAFTAFRWPNPA